MAWVYLFIAVAGEIVWAISLKATVGFSRLGPSLFNIFVAAGNIFLLSLAMKDLPAGTAYTVWTGLGAVGVSVFGVLLYNEGVDLPRVGCIGLIILGVCGLKFFSPG